MSTPSAINVEPRSHPLDPDRIDNSLCHACDEVHTKPFRLLFYRHEKKKIGGRDVFVCLEGWNWKTIGFCHLEAEDELVSRHGRVGPRGSKSAPSLLLFLLQRRNKPPAPPRGCSHGEPIWVTIAHHPVNPHPLHPPGRHGVGGGYHRPRRIPRRQRHAHLCRWGVRARILHPRRVQEQVPRHLVQEHRSPPGGGLGGEQREPHRRPLRGAPDGRQRDSGAPRRVLCRRLVFWVASGEELRRPAPGLRQPRGERRRFPELLLLVAELRLPRENPPRRHEALRGVPGETLLHLVDERGRPFAGELHRADGALRGGRPVAGLPEEVPHRPLERHPLQRRPGDEHLHRVHGHLRPRRRRQHVLLRVRGPRTGPGAALRRLLRRAASPHLDEQGRRLERVLVGAQGPVRPVRELRPLRRLQLQRLPRLQVPGGVPAEVAAGLVPEGWVRGVRQEDGAELFGRWVPPGKRDEAAGHGERHGEPEHGLGRVRGALPEELLVHGVRRRQHHPGERERLHHLGRRPARSPPVRGQRAGPLHSPGSFRTEFNKQSQQAKDGTNHNRGDGSSSYQYPPVDVERFLFLEEKEERYHQGIPVQSQGRERDGAAFI
uniref:Putative ubiquinone biosynthesis protein UbiB n=1 Tax=Anthurium amnicola TaxID=1678845 RepID=A0A1D1XQD3_9ARAE